MNFTDYTSYTFDAVRSVSPADVDALVDLLFDAYDRGAMVFVIGNGGSAANASHLAQDLAKGTLASPDQTKRLKALSLTDNLPFLSALGNDEGYDKVFVQQLRTFASADDLLVAISGSGNSPNILQAIEYAREKGMKTVGVTGFDGGALRSLVDLSVHVPLDDMCTSESVHSVIFHYAILELKDRIANDSAK